MTGYKCLSKDNFNKLINYCSIISFRYNVICGLNPNEIESVYNEIALTINSEKRIPIEKFAKVYIDDEQFCASFSRKEFTPRQNQLVKYILSKLEANIYNHKSDHNTFSITIEHILPVSADENWGDFNDETINRCVHKLGNLTLIESNLNKEADIKQFNNKKTIYDASFVQLTKELVAIDNWCEDSINERQKKLANYAKSIWKINF